MLSLDLCYFFYFFCRLFDLDFLLFDLEFLCWICLIFIFITIALSSSFRYLTRISFGGIRVWFLIPWEAWLNSICKVFLDSVAYLLFISPFAWGNTAVYLILLAFLYSFKNSSLLLWWNEIMLALYMNTKKWESLK